MSQTTTVVRALGYINRVDVSIDNKNEMKQEKRVGSHFIANADQINKMDAKIAQLLKEKELLPPPRPIFSSLLNAIRCTHVPPNHSRRAIRNCDRTISKIKKLKKKLNRKAAEMERKASKHRVNDQNRIADLHLSKEDLVLIQ